MTPSSVEQSLHGRDLVGLFGDVDVGEHEGGVGGQRAEHLCSGAVVEIVKLPRSVLPSSAMLACYPPERAAWSAAAWRRKTASTAFGSSPFRM